MPNAIFPKERACRKVRLPQVLFMTSCTSNMAGTGRGEGGRGKDAPTCQSMSSACLRCPASMLWLRVQRVCLVCFWHRWASPVWACAEGREEELGTVGMLLPCSCLCGTACCVHIRALAHCNISMLGPKRSCIYMLTTSVTHWLVHMLFVLHSPTFLGCGSKAGSLGKLESDDASRESERISQ